MSASVWECRICGRRIPLRVDECFCGAKRAQVVAQQQREADRSPTKIPLDVAFLVALVVLVGVYGLHRALRPEPAPPAPGGSLLSGMLATPAPIASLALPQTAAPVPEAPASIAPPAILPPVAESGTPPPNPTPRTSPSPSPSASPEVDDREQNKAAALAAYSAELGRLASMSSRMAEHTRAYRTGCVGQSVGVQISNCGEIEAAVRKALGELEQGLDAAEDQARRAWLEPGKVREARAHTFFGTREWEELQRAARQLGR